MSNKKIPGIFRKKFKEKKWKKKIIRNIHIPSDRKMVESLYENQNGRMIIKQEIPPEVLKKLKPLSKAIKKNKGMVTKWKALILLVVAGAILVFTFFFKNKVLENVMESSLEKVFQADVDVVKPRFSLFRGNFGFESLTIQDKNDPGKNMIETGGSDLSISIPELTRNRFRIEAMVLENVRLDTPRESDALEVVQQKSGETKQPLDLSSLKDLTDDPTAQIEALIEEQKENLQTFKIIEGANKELEEFTARWENSFNDSRKEVEQFTQKFSGIATQGVPSITSIEDGKALLKEYEGYYKEIEAEKDKVLALQNQFQEEKERIQNYREGIEETISSDLEYLRSLITLPQKQDMQNFVSDKIKDILRKRFENYYDKAMKLMPLYEKFKAQRDEKVVEEKEYRRYPGRYVLYPSPENPRFLIEEARIDGGDSNSGFFGGSLTGITSEPDKWPEPVKLNSHWEDNNTSMTLGGFLDLKDQAPELFNIQFESPGNPVSWDDGISALGIEAAHAGLSYHGTSRSELNKEGVAVAMEMNFNDIELETSGNDDLISKIILETVSDISSFIVSAELLITKDGIKSLKVNSDIDNILKEKLGDLLKDLPQQGMDELETYLRDLISKELAGSDAVNKALDALNMESLDQLRSLDDLQAAVKKVEDQAQGRADALIKDLQDKAAAEAAKLQAEAAAEAERLKAEAAAEAARVKAEADAKAKAEADRLKREAEEKARLEAEKLKDQNKVKIPGF